MGIVIEIVDGKVVVRLSDKSDRERVDLPKGKSIVRLPSEYVCIDTETTGLDFQYCDLIELAAARVKDGQIVDTFSELVKPPHEIDEFIEKLTGITNEMLSTARSIKEVIPDYLDFCGDSVIVGHNVSFDVNFICAAAEENGLHFQNDYVDEMRIARKLFPNEEHHRLKDVAKYCCVEQEKKHRAGSDVETTVHCFEKMKGMVLESYTEDEFSGLFKKKYIPKKEVISGIAQTVDEIDESNPFYGKVVVFTGALSRMARKDAWQIVVNMGGIPADSVTKKTNFLVIGNEDFAASVKNGKTSKMKRAEKLQEDGFDIVTLSEDAFFSMVE